MWKSNPYLNGVVLLFDEESEEAALHRLKYTYIKSPNDKIHTVRDFDTISDLAYDYYGDSKWWTLIADANDLESPWVLPASGTGLIIPDLSRYKSST
jgi:nucleoid-associated protein YgaU